MMAQRLRHFLVLLRNQHYPGRLENDSPLTPAPGNHEGICSTVHGNNVKMGYSKCDFIRNRIWVKLAPTHREHIEQPGGRRHDGSDS